MRFTTQNAVDRKKYSDLLPLSLFCIPQESLTTVPAFEDKVLHQINMKNSVIVSDIFKHLNLESTINFVSQKCILNISLLQISQF